jgi:putative heme iron utilization protein
MLAPAKPELVCYLSENPGAVIEEAAKLHAVTPRDVVEALPAEMRRLGPADSFIAAMQDVATWGDVTLIIHTDDGIMEFGGRSRVARSARLFQPDGFEGLPRPSAAGAVAGSSSWAPFMGKLSALIVFFNVDGGIMFKILSAAMTSATQADQLAKFRSLGGQLCEADAITCSSPTSAPSAGVGEMQIVGWGIPRPVSLQRIALVPGRAGSVRYRGIATEDQTAVDAAGKS